jgi:hypothetical protein
LVWPFSPPPPGFPRDSLFRIPHPAFVVNLFFALFSFFSSIQPFI